MKKLRFPSIGLPGLAVAVLLLGGCSKASDEPAPAATPPPAGTNYTVVRSGTVLAQGGVASGGTVDIVKASSGAELVRFNKDFFTDFHTGSLSIYLAKSSDQIRNQQAADPTSVVRVGTITQSGAQLLPITGSATGFSHLILHCDPAQYNFGAAALH
ncbi:MAG: hypothetical protein NVS3B25_22480 [Hymenobacter sp.]